MGALRIWLMAARPRTLPAAIAPVLVGSAAALVALRTTTGVGVPAVVSSADPDFSWSRCLAALVGAVFIQIGTNLANDYSDAKRGADTVDRLGPVRVTASGLAAPRRVLHATWAAFAIAALAGTYLAIEVGPEIIAIGVASIIAGVLYTGGPRPYGYEGLGEVFVFIFFGLVAVNGSYYVQLETLDLLPLLLSLPVGLLSAAILVVNNVRDIDTDRRAGKRTLAVRFGRERTRALYKLMIVTSFALLPVALLLAGGPALGLLGLLAAPLAIGPLRAVRNDTDGPSLNGALAGTGALLAAFAALVSVGLVI
ncbi:MAG: 1,4-dihydroxy-2-naphthoate polyprenyltransferase [Solirubrobacterales bacterium]